MSPREALSSQAFKEALSQNMKPCKPQIRNPQALKALKRKPPKPLKA